MTAPIGRSRSIGSRPTGVAGASVDSVTGKRVAGPLQGFGQLWQKTFRVPLEGSSMSPQEVIAVWKERFATFWPKAGRFYAPLAGIVPGEVALLDIAPVPGAPVKFSTGVMVIYADDESFTFITPEGHMLSAWITFSAYRDGDVTVAQVQALERTSDPFDELGLMFGGSRMNDRFWRRHARQRGAGDGCNGPSSGFGGRVHRQAPSVAARRQHPQQHHASDDAPHPHGSRALDFRPKLGSGAA